MSDLVKYILSHEDAFRKNRLPSLYSDFALQKSTNPDGYAVNVAAWEKALTNAARTGHVASNNASSKKRDHLVLVADENLLHMLESPEWGRPVALASVFEEAIRKRNMVPLEVYRSNNFSLSTSRWRVLDPGVVSPWNVMNWSLRQLRGLVVGTDNGSAKLRTQTLVLVDNLKEAAKQVLDLQGSQKASSLDRIYSKERFTKTFGTVLGDTELSDNDLQALLIYLSRDINAISYDGKTIKFHTSNDKSPVTPEDTTIAHMRDLISNLTEQISRLEEKIGEFNANAKKALANKNRISALSAVKNKKITEHNLDQRVNTLHQLEEVYNKIEQSADQIEIVRVMQASTGVLRSLHAQMGGIETVENVVENLREEMSKVDEVGNVINEAGPVIDEGEINDELEALETKELREKEEEEEAKATRQRFEQLESHEQAAREAAARLAEASQTAEAMEGVESELAKSIGQLSTMSLNDSTETERETKQPVPAE